MHYTAAAVNSLCGPWECVCSSGQQMMTIKIKKYWLPTLILLPHNRRVSIPLLISNYLALLHVQVGTVAYEQMILVMPTCN